MKDWHGTTLEDALLYGATHFGKSNGISYFFKFEGGERYYFNHCYGWDKDIEQNEPPNSDLIELNEASIIEENPLTDFGYTPKPRPSEVKIRTVSEVSWDLSYEESEKIYDKLTAKQQNKLEKIASKLTNIGDKLALDYNEVLALLRHKF